CPSQPVKEWFRLTQGGLFLDELVSQAANGVKRSIQIDKPAAGDQVGSTIQLTGSETVAPFENNLVYRVYDETNQQLGEGSITAKSEGTGGPVTFDAAVNLPTIPPGKEFWVSVMDLSAKDGSTLAQASVRLVSQQQ
ncbi:MAG TPA: Gmad2 immunoglobulin-like domain-containing protein, partial [Candidatus Methylomirabilis sp.]|nr:Gmad2 immunoglobulin-like domain-containing protein [Candidatus Methylomirabilis sp.]